jgi:hypothetical protein
LFGLKSPLPPTPPEDGRSKDILPCMKPHTKIFFITGFDCGRVALTQLYAKEIWFISHFLDKMF